MADRVLVWGKGSYFAKHYDMVLHVLEKTEAIKIVAYIERENSTYFQFDTSPIISPKEIKQMEFDYIIVASSFFKEIFEEAVSQLQIESEKIIDARVLNYETFDWKRYIEIKKKRITLITESCYGGCLFHELGLKFRSPFINTQIDPYEYIKMLNNLDFYLNLPLETVSDIPKTEDLEFSLATPNLNLGMAGYPYFKLGDVGIHAVHAKSTVAFLQEWESRIERVKAENIMVMMIIENDELAEMFAELPIKNKVGFYYKDLGYDNIICLKEYSDKELRHKYAYMFRRYVHSLVYGEGTLQTVDFLKILNNEKGYYRIS